MSRIIVVVIAAIILLPWGSRTHFNTKGEPREAIVAVSMINSGNWILPESYGHDIPYKPPMLAWCIAAIAELNGGEVTEYISRLPSELAAFALILMTFGWVARRRDPVTAALTALVTLTSFEMMRNAMICRVDMLLTFFIVGSIYLLDTDGIPRRRVPWRIVGAVILMSCATLTKGPVGALLPCLVAGVYRLLLRKNFFATFFKLTAVAVAAMILPALWYYAAYLQGGDEFLDLAMEENIGRLTGTMTYDSHLNPWWYNIICVIWGMAPYTILVLLALWPLSRRRGNSDIRRGPAGPDAILALCGALLVIGFYCIPASKRSVYLLPAYPFMAFGVVLLYNRLMAMRSAVPAVYFNIIAWLGVTVTVAMVALRCGAADFVTGKNAVFISALAHGAIGWWEWIVILLPAAVSLLLWKSMSDLNPLAKSVISLSAIYIAYFATIQPLLLNGRSNLRQAQELEAMQPEGEIYTFLNDKYMRYFTVNYYLGDRLRMAEKADSLPDGKLLLMNSNRAGEFHNLFPDIRLEAEPMTFVSCDKRRDTVTVYRIHPDNP